MFSIRLYEEGDGLHLQVSSGAYGFLIVDPRWIGDWTANFSGGGLSHNKSRPEIHFTTHFKRAGNNDFYFTLLPAYLKSPGELRLWSYTSRIGDRETTRNLLIKPNVPIKDFNLPVSFFDTRLVEFGYVGKSRLVSAKLSTREGNLDLTFPSEITKVKLSSRS